MLHLVTCTLFADKSGVYIDDWHMCLFILYTTLIVVNVFETRQLVGYLSLLQVYLKLLFVV